MSDDIYAPPSLPTRPDQEERRYQSQRCNRHHDPPPPVKGRHALHWCSGRANDGDEHRDAHGERRLPTRCDHARARSEVAARIIMIQAEPVANDDDRRPEAATPIRVGNVSPTPMPVGIMPMM